MMASISGKAMLYLLAGAALAAAAAKPAMAAPADLEARADAYIESAWPADGPGVAVIITDDGRTVYARGHGVADLEAGAPITPETVFRLGSITKQFTAAVILQLAQEERLSLDDPVSKFLPDYPEPGARATVRQLLNHTVGVQSYTGIPGWMVEENTAQPRTTDELIAEFRDHPAPSQPGEAFAYNNSGYVLLGAIVERVTGMSWHQAVRERIAEPLGLATIRFGGEERDIAAMARGYTRDGGRTRPAQRIHMSNPHAAGALVGNVHDLAAWAQALHHGRVVDAEHYRAMTSPTRIPEDVTVPYGFGLALGDVRGRPTIGHGGGIYGFITDSLYIAEEDIFVAILTNSDQPATPPGVALRRLAGLALDDPFPDFERVDADVAALEPLFGVYSLDAAPDRHFYARDGRLFTRRAGAPEMEAFAAGEGRFFYGSASLSWFVLRRDDQGRPVMEMHEQGAHEAELAVWTGPVPPEPEVANVPRRTLERYIGTYGLPRGTVTIAWGEDGKLMGQISGRPAVTLVPVSATEFRPQGVDARIVFMIEGDSVAAVVLRQGGGEIRAERLAASP